MGVHRRTYEVHSLSLVELYSEGEFPRVDLYCQSQTEDIFSQNHIVELYEFYTLCIGTQDTFGKAIRKFQQRSFADFLRSTNMLRLNGCPIQLPLVIFS